jgi:ComF family protein
MLAPLEKPLGIDSAARRANACPVTPKPLPWRRLAQAPQHARAWLRGRLAPRCLLCQIEPGAPVCAGCSADFLPQRHRCSVCAIGLPESLAATRCGACVSDPPQFDRTIALADYAAPISQVIVMLKFGHRLALADDLGRLLAGPLRAAAPDLLCAVPLSYERERSRGFNQSAEISRSAATESGIDYVGGLLLRVRDAAPQMTLKRTERRRNVKGVFAVRGEVAGRHVGVIDDVMTTGSTLDELARTLKAAGAARVSNFVIARTP